MPSPTKTLTPFKDELPIPEVVRPHFDLDESTPRLTIHMKAAKVQLHSELPATEAWTYEGTLPGPTIEVSRGKRIRVTWKNEITNTLPIAVVTATETPGAPSPQNEPGPSGGTVVEGTPGLEPWTVVHLHGGRTEAGSDGWTEDVATTGQNATSIYDLWQRGSLLWYHDHAMGITRLNVCSGLAGLFVIRDHDEEERARLPHGEYEIPLLLMDRNLQTDSQGFLTGQMLHKVTDQTMEYFGPYTLVNGKIWPYRKVEPHQYRVRIINGSNARTYRLSLIDENRQVRNDAIRQIGSDGGLLRNPVSLPTGGLVLAPAERADLVIDFRKLKGLNVKLVNTAGAPFDNSDGPMPGDPAPDQLLPYPEVLQFRVGHHSFAYDQEISENLSDCVRLTHEMIGHHNHRNIMLVEGPDASAGMDLLTLRELEMVPDADASGRSDLVDFQAKDGTVTHFETTATRFEDRVNFMIEKEGWEIWNIFNFTPDTHPFHVHLVQFQILSRQQVDASGFQSETGSTLPGLPIAYTGDGVIDDNETGWKDVIRINPGERISIAMQFSGYAGRYMYHCHVLEHEDMEMMRPFVVLPASILRLMPKMGDMHMAPVRSPKTATAA